MRQYAVEFKAGESRTRPGEGIDYMHVILPEEDEDGIIVSKDENLDFHPGGAWGLELYAELENTTADEAATYDDLKAAILEQAAANGVSSERLQFYYDD
jgi:hypothetical protein